MSLGIRLNSGIFLGLLFAAFARLAAAQCPQNDGTVINLQTYPLSSTTYSVQYQIDGGAWTPAMVYISYYGATTGSPYRNDSRLYGECDNDGGHDVDVVYQHPGARKRLGEVARDQALRYAVSSE